MTKIVETRRRGWGSRSKSSLGRALGGLLLVVLGTVLLFWNEGRSVQRYKDLKEGAGAVVSVDAAPVDPANEGRLVHVTGEAVVSGAVSDPQFGVSAEAVRLERSVEMYQWVERTRTEERRTVGGGAEEVTTTTYEQEWRSSLVDSSRFKEPAGHANPSAMRFRSESFTASDVSLGAFRLPPFLVSKIGGAEPLPAESLDTLPEALREEARIHGGELYFGENPAAPAVGDLRVRFSQIPPGPVSVVAQQQGDTFVSYTTSTGGTLDLLQRGIVSAEEMFQRAEGQNRALTWGIRIGGFFLLAIAFSMILGPLGVFADVLPFLGRIVRAGTSVIAFLLAGILWSATVAFSWIFHRPVLGVAILAVTVALVALAVVRIRRGRSAASGPAAATEAGAPPPLS